MDSKKKLKEKLKEEVRKFPDRPGVYIMKNGTGKILYIGKAGSLKKRVSSYFLKNRDIKTKFLVDKIEKVEHIVTKNDYEALLLENNLIKQWSPYYNINLKDGKTYPVIRITNEDFPQIFRTRRIVNDGSLYFGPYTDVHSIDLYLELIEKLFRIRKCRGKLKSRSSPCLYYHIHRCDAPCCGYISKEKYSKMVDEVKGLLSGKGEQLQYSLREKMETAAEKMEYEQAALYRDSLQAVETTGQKQAVVDNIEKERDYIGFVEEETIGSFGVFQMRGGKLTGQDILRTDIFEGPEEAVEHFLLQYYSPEKPPPPEIYIPFPIDDEKIGKYFADELKVKTALKVPQSGRHYSLLKMVEENSRIDLLRRLENKENNPALRELKDVLGLSVLPGRIEGFDIAQLGGTSPVASMVSFLNGKPDKSNYRKYHIRSLHGKIDDFKSIREVVARRYTKIVNEGLEPPDLILVDGGKGQVSSAVAVLRSIGLGSVPVFGLAKRIEEIVPSQGPSFTLPETSPALRLLQHVRDEAHRFATTFQKQMREKGLDLPTLRQIPGIGEKRAVRLMKEFGSVDAITTAAPEELTRRAGLPAELAATVSAWCRDGDGG